MYMGSIWNCEHVPLPTDRLQHPGSQSSKVRTEVCKIEYSQGPSWLSCIQWNLTIENTIGTQLAVLYTVEPHYRGHHWDPAGCPVYSGTSL